MHKTLKTYCELCAESFEELDNKNNADLVPFTRDVFLINKHVVKCNNLLLAQGLFNDILRQLNYDGQNFGLVSSDALIHEPTVNSTTFKIKIIGAKMLGLQNRQCPDPYVVMTLGGQIVGATNIVKSNVNPNWNCEYLVHLPNSLADSKSFITMTVYHDNKFGNEVLIGSCAVFLRDVKVQNFLTHKFTRTLRPQGSLTMWIRREGEIDDTEWYIQRSLECIRFSIEYMLRCSIEKIIRILSTTLEQLVKSSQGTKLFGVSIVPAGDIDDEVVEQALGGMFEYFDSTLGLLNQYADRRFDKLFKVMFPEISVNEEETPEVDDTTPAISADPIKTDVPGGLLDATTEELQKDTINYRANPAYIRLLWREIVLFAQSVLDGMMSLEAEEKREAQILESLIEYLKALFHCMHKGRPLGLTIDELETPVYRHLRFTFGEILG